MKEKKFTNSRNSFTLIVFYMITIFIDQTSSKLCDLEDFRYIDRKVFCEADNGVSTSCLGTPFPVTRAYIQCSNKYHNDKNISQLIIDCNDGEWTDSIFTCRPECDDSPVSFTLINNPKEEYPPWYAEIVEFAPNNTIKNIYPSIIFAERHVATKKEFLKNGFNEKNFIIRIPRLKYKKPKEYYIHYEDKGANNHKLFLKVPNETEEETKNSTTIVHIDPVHYIQFDDVTLPACDKVYSEKDKGILKLLHFDLRLNFPRWYEKVLPLQEKNCFVPRVDYTRMEVECFHDKSGPPTICKNRADSALLRCQIGYEQTNSPTSDHIARCFFLNRWFYRYGEANNCNLVCGEIDPNYRPKQTTLIHRGSKTHTGFAPWHVAIYLIDKRKQTVMQICGGTLIHSNTVLSAAHCFYNTGTNRLNNASNYLIAAGKFYRQYETQEESEQYANVLSIHIPHNYEQLPIKNDVAVLILDHHLRYTPLVKPICIDFSSNIIPENLEGHIVGWGATSIDDEISNELLTANFTTVTNKQCRTIVGPRDKSEITNEKFCAINEKGSTACQGDSGGGFVVKKRVGDIERYFLLGVISVGLNSEKYCSDGFTTVFTNILIYEDLIKNKTSAGRNDDFFKNIEAKYPFNNENASF
ncbi:mannan-binding lectin serine protease 1-like [Condylostylus longicornis]|uniref:mannan-binding lectin serine protease 1-like n=1 Tax=Condylostylus longicornis TaxID=2530218 RepID=UPI00244E2F05|nr:mannan-binding lectin serine protease 1-like [Condylostylus longicornis]